MADDGGMAPMQRLYVRDLPGGGFVAIDLIADGVPGEAQSCRARISVERRASEERRSGHAAPIIAEASGETRSDVFGELYRVACDNVAVARGLLQWRRQRVSEPVEALV